MIDALAQFHLLRPWALLGLLPAALLLWLLWRRKAAASQWRQYIDPGLLPHLLDGAGERGSRRLLAGLGAIWLLAILALSGPAWEQRPSPVQRQVDALVLILDLSPSMVVEDVAPTRMVRARLKVAEILQRRQEGETGLIVYGGDAHVVTPLTADTDTIASLLPSLSPGVMPLPGSNTEAAIARAVEMLEQANMGSGRILLVTDGVDPRAESGIAKALKNTPYSLSILGVGTADGAPIPSGRGDFVRDGDNQVIISQLDSGYLQTLARRFGGRYSGSHFDGRDLDHLLPEGRNLTREHRETEQTIDQWYDRGPWLVLLLLPLLLYCFRRGVLMVWLLPAALVLSPQADALQPEDLWLTPDQQGARALAEGDAGTAAERFRDPAWKGTAAYRAGDYQGAIDHFSQLDTARAHYNRGNALAQQGKLEEAIAAYDQALERDSQHTDAAANKQLLEQLKEQQQQQSEGKQDGEQGEQQSGEQENSGESQEENEQGGKDNGEQNGEESSEERDPRQRDSSDNGESGNSGGQTQDNPPPKPGEESPSPTGAEDGQSDSEPPTDEQPAEPESAEPEPTEAESEQSATPQSDEEQSAAETEEGEAQAALTEAEAREQQQALEQWLRQVPDDPAGLLRNKFRYQYQRRTEERIEQKINPFNDDEQRW